MWIVRWDPFLMKKLLKSEIRGSVNSAQCELIVWKLFDKSNFVATVYAPCMNSSRNSKICPKIREKKRTKQKKRKHRCKRRTQTHTKWFIKKNLTHGPTQRPLWIRLVHVFKNWKLLFKNFCENTCKWKNV